MRRDPSPEREGAIRVLRDCLGVEKGQELLIVADEVGLKLAHALHAAAQQLAAKSWVAFFSQQEQQRIRGHADLHPSLVAAFGVVHAAANCLSGDAAHTDFRGALVAQRRVGLKIAHMPGATRQLLGHVLNVDYAALQSAAERLVYPLFLGTTIEIDTGRNYTFTARLAGMKHVPVPSTGIIADGSWGNIPGAETYASPVRGTAEGELLVDGSLLKHVVGRRDPVLVSFRDGVLRTYHSKDTVLLQAMTDLERLARARNERNWRNVAEIGIGLNPNVKRLTGNALVDEKKALTAHVAVGRSEGFGGDVDCAFHEDLVFKRPTIRVDGRLVVDRGVLVTTAEDWLEALVPPSQATAWGRGIRYVCRGNQSTSTRDGLLFHVLEAGSGRTVCIQVGRALASVTAREVYDWLPESVGTRVTLEELAQRRKPLSETLRALKLLEDRGLVLVHRAS